MSPGREGGHEALRTYVICCLAGSGSEQDNMQYFTKYVCLKCFI